MDQNLISAVKEYTPYANNTQELTLNENDSILAEEASDIDPVVQYVLLGDTIEEGVFGFISLGIDTSASYTVSAAATLTENGGVLNENSGGPGGGGAPPDASGSAGGAIPSGSDIPDSGVSPSASAI